MSSPTRSSAPTEFASTRWRWACDCRLCPMSGNWSKREARVCLAPVLLDEWAHLVALNAEHVELSFDPLGVSRLS